MKPITRIDMYLAVISGDEDAVTPLPEPVTRIDHYLAYLASENVAELPEPVTRIDFYLAKLCGMDLEIPEEPITRIDFYLAVLNGETVDLPNAVTRIDYYLDAWAQGGGDLPWQTFTGNPLQFNAPKAHTLKSVKVEFSPIQSGSGDPSPDNVRPITGWTGANITRAGENLFDAQSFAEGNIVYNSDGSLYVPTNNLVLSKKSWDNVTGYTGQVAITFKYKYANTGTGGAIPRIFYTDGTAESVTTPTETEFNTVKKVSSAGKTIDYIGWTYGTGSNSTTFYLQISLGATASDTVKPYVGQSTTLAFPSTVYGGTAEVAEDGSVTLTATWAKISLNSGGGWTKSGSYSGGFYCSWKQTSPSIYSVYGVDFKPNTPFKCSHAKTANTLSEYLVGTCFSDNSCNIRIMTAETTVQEWKDYLDAQYNNGTPVEVCGQLATPIVTHLSSVTQLTALVGINTMWSDTNGDLTVEARAEAVNLNALQSLNMLLGGRYYNNGTADEPTDEEALDILLGR